MDSLSLPHVALTYSEWTSLQESSHTGKPVSIDGRSLTIPQVIAVCLYGAKPVLTKNSMVIDRIQQSVDFLNRELLSGRTIYGVNTGFGGSAGTRTTKFETLQIALQQLLNVGILLPSDKGISPSSSLRGAEELLRGHALPVPVVKAMMLIRCNSLMRGHSGVRIGVIESILTLLAKNMTPVVPLRGSISASGDLCPLSYIASALEGNPDVYVRLGTDENDSASFPTYLPADKALERAGLRPVHLQAKEGLGIMNGTATSCAAACVAIHQAQQIAVLAQLLTAMGTEALLGTADNYHPFVSVARPHRGQIEAAVNIRAFLSGSKIAPVNGKRVQTQGLAQDRYALRTAPQWIGPQIEDLLLAHHQIVTEVNSTTDNPLIDLANKDIHNSGNFQAASVTSAMEKTMTAMQMLGKLLYAQSTELVNNMLNKGLAPNLSADDPSLSFTFKGLDINMAAYISELGYLAHPVSVYGQIAEMGNQSINSLALVAARYTLEAVEVVSLMAATYLYALCQALDLRCMHFEFVKEAEPTIRQIVHDLFQPVIEGEAGSDTLESKAWVILLEKWESLSHLDLADRGPAAAKESLGPFLEQLMSHSPHPYPDHETHFQGSATTIFSPNTDMLALAHDYQKKAGQTLIDVYGRIRVKFFSQQTTPEYIGLASKVIYEFIRHELNIPMHRGLVDHPTKYDRYRSGPDPGQKSGPREKKITGTLASEIYLSVRDGRLHSRVMKAWSLVRPESMSSTNKVIENTSRQYALRNML